MARAKKHQNVTLYARIPAKLFSKLQRIRRSQSFMKDRDFSMSDIVTQILEHGVPDIVEGDPMGQGDGDGGDSDDSGKDGKASKGDDDEEEPAIRFRSHRRIPGRRGKRRFAFPYLPSPPEIRESCEIIQAGWTAIDRYRRRGGSAEEARSSDMYLDKLSGDYKHHFAIDDRQFSVLASGTEGGESSEYE